MKSIRIAIIDYADSPANRIDIGGALGHGFELTGHEQQSSRIAALCEGHTSDVVLISARQPMTELATIARNIAEKCPDVRVIVLSISPDIGLIRSLLILGVTGILLAEETMDCLPYVVRAVYSGKTVLSPAVAQLLLSGG